MVEAKMRIGPKGQVVIPKLIRDEFGLAPGDEVLVGESPEGVIVKKLNENPVAVFARAAKSKRRVKHVDLHGYERAIEDRWAKVKKHGHLS